MQPAVRSTPNAKFSPMEVMFRNQRGTDTEKQWKTERKWVSVPRVLYITHTCKAKARFLHNLFMNVLEGAGT